MLTQTTTDNGEILQKYGILHKQKHMADKAVSAVFQTD